MSNIKYVYGSPRFIRGDFYSMVNMKNKEKNKKLVGKAAAIGTVGSAVFLALGWPFFHFIAYAAKEFYESKLEEFFAKTK